ncbi:MAG: hypothetical protein JWN40_4225 [Phycisphaerales bacterium]|nr:hypothetical protein [Phycisphaerales bacterium]
MRSLFILPLLLSSSFALAQAPQLLVKNPDNPAEKPHPITLAKADVQLFIAGQLCRTTMTLTFQNDADRVLEGELVFPLPENATVCGYGLDVGGQIVEAVTIEKEKARVVFESETRRGIDPGIVEQVQGNNFRTRVHPIPAKGTRTIRVQYVSDPSAAGDQLVYKLPLQWPGSTPELTVEVEAISASAPKVEALPELKFQSDGDHHIARQRIEKAAIAVPVVATLPAASLKPAVVEKRTHSAVSLENLDPKTVEQFARTDYYFVATDLPTPAPTTTTATRAKAGRIAIAWDASLSRGKVDHAKEFELIKNHLAALGDVIVDVVPFRNVPEAAKTLRITRGDSAKLLEHLAALPYDGGTSLSSVEFTRRSRIQDETLPNIDYWLLFTDGLSNLGPDLPAKVEAPVYAISNDPRSNHNLLRRLSASSGGQYLNLEALTADQALAGLTASPFSLLSIDADPKEIADIYPRLPQPVQGRVTIAGRLLAPTATLTLNYGRNGAVTQRVPITLVQAGASEMNLVSRYWAQLKLTDLSANLDRNEIEITALGKQFNLVTPYTSMIVLETLDQYLRHKIIPPKSRGEIYSQFMQQIEQQQAVAQKDERAKIDRVVTMWNNRVAWWNQEFKYAADFKYKEPQQKKEPALATAEGALSEDVVRIRRSDGATPTTGRPAAEARAGLRGADTAAAAPAADPIAPAAATPPAPSPAAVTRVYDARDLAVQVPDFDHAPSFSLSDQSRQAPRGGGGGSGGGGLFGGGGGRPEHLYRGSVVNPSSAIRANGDVNIDGVVDAAIALRPWSPDTPYLKSLQSAPAEQAYTVYLKERKSYESSPAFYLDCADFFAKPNPDLALRILTNIPELALDDGRLLRIAAHRLQQLKELDLAIDLFERIVRLRPEEPQSFRDLALALADRADAAIVRKDADRARSDYQRAVDLLHKVVMNPWDRFEEVEVIALTEANRILARVNSLSTQDSPLRTLKNPFDPRLTQLLDPDLRIVMTWDTDNTDIDLHVTEPTGETCFYSHNRTVIGGALSKDFTQGYGPEEYLLKKLMPGEYKIQAHFFGSRDQQFVGPTTVQATIITHFGRPDEKRQAITLRLKDAKDMVDIGTVT